MNYRFLSLVREFAITDFKLKYHGSILGYFWSLLNPLLMFGILYIVFSLFVRFDIENYNLYLLLGIIIWGYFTEATLNSMTAWIAKSRIIKNIYFQRTIIVIASNLTALLGFVLNMVVFFIFFYFSDIRLSLNALLLPFYVILLFLITIGFSFILSALHLKFLDVQHIWRILLQIFFWATPIVYPLLLVPKNYRNIFLLNPFSLIIENTRDILIYSKSVALSQILLATFCSLVIFLIGYLIYKKMSDKFPEWV